MSGLIDNPQLTFDDLSSVETHQEEFGNDKTLPKTPKVIGKSKAEEWVKSLKEKQRAERKTQGQVKLTGGASTAHRLTEFEIDPEKIALAESLGEKAFKEGMIAPANDKEFLKIIEGSKVGEAKPYLEAWNKGWTKTNIHDTKPVHTDPKTKKKSEIEEVVENIMERVRAAKTVKEAAKLNQELNLQSFKHNIPHDKMETVYSLIRATIDRLYQEKELKEAQEKAVGETKPEPKPEPKKEEPKQDIEVTLLNRIRAAKTHAELQEVAKDMKEYLYSLPSQSGFRKEHDPGMVVSRAYSERLRELTAVQPIPPEQTAKLHAWGHKELDAFKFYRDQESKKYQRNIDYVKKEKKDFEELTDKLNKDPENKTMRWNWRQARKTLETNLSRMPYWEKTIENYNSPDWIEKHKDSYREKYIKEVKEAISKGKSVPAEVIGQYHEFRKARDARERYEKGWKTSFANVSAAVVEGTKETTGVKVKRQDGKPITKQQIEEIASGLKDIQAVIGNIMPVMKTENITVAHTSGKYPFLSQAGGMYHPTEKSVTMGIAGTNATAHEIAHFLDDVAKTQIPQTEPKYDLKLIGEASARINNYYGVDRMLSLSPKKTKEEKEAARLLRAHLGSYWRRQEEIFARLVEQYIAFKNQKNSTAYNSVKFYEKTPGWWTHDDFLQLLPMVEAELKRKLDLAYKKVGMTSAPAPLPVQFAAAPVIKSDVKQPWKMTQKEYVNMRTEQAGAFDFGFPQYHKSHVEEAIKQGLPVPEEVLKEYPDLMNLKKNPDINWKFPKLTKDEEIVWMSPEEFLSKVPHPGLPAHLRIPASRDTNEKYYDSYSLKSIAERIEKGWELNVPFINYTHDAFGWAEHDGRHRALTALKMGIKKIPVLIIGKPLIKNPGDIIGDKPNPIMKQQLLKLWKQLLGAEDLGDFETFMKEVSDLTYHEAKEKLLKTYGSPKGKEGEKAIKAEAQACDYAMEQCNEGVKDACTTACQDCHIKEACEKAPIDMTGLVEDKTGERTSRLRIDSGALKGKTAFRCPECFRGLTKTDKGLVCGEHGLIPLTGPIQVGSHTLGQALDLRQIGKDKAVTKQAKETLAWFLEEAKEAGFKTVKEYYDSLKDKERDSFKEYARLGVGLEEMFSKPEKPEKPAKSDYQVLNDWLDKSEKEIDSPEGVEKYKSDWQNTFKEIYDRLPKPDQDMIFSRLTGITQYIYDKKKEAEAKIMTETPPTEEVKEWLKKAHGITDYKGIRSDRIGMLMYIVYKGEIGKLRDRNEALAMAIALGKDLGYGEPPTPDKLKPDERYKSIERYYAEKIANETGKEVPIIMGSSVVKPEVLPAPEDKKMTETEFIPNAALVNKQLADRSHMGTSFDPEKRAEQEISGFVQDVQNVYDDLKRYAKSDAQKTLLIEEMRKFQAGYAQKYNAKLSAHGNTISSFITGGSKFPTRRAEKANASYDKRFQEMLDYKERAQKAIIRKLKGEGIEEEGGEIAHLQNKLEAAERNQVLMVAANKIIRKKHEPGIEGVSKHKQLVDLGLSEQQATELLKPDFMGRVGYSFHLQNNNQEIHRLKDRIAQLQKKEITESREFEFTSGSIKDNQEDDRVQIFFDQKPAQDTINKLKAEGWRWSPSIGAWQRKRTEYALMSANRITGAQAETQFGKTEPAKPETPAGTVTGTENWFDSKVEKIQQWSESGTMMGLISKDEAINLVKSGKYKVVNGVAVTELPHLGSAKAIPLAETEERIKKAQVETKKPELKTTPTAIITSLAKQRAAEWFKTQVKNPYERYYLYHRAGDFQVSNTDMPGYTISHPERISPAWTVDQASQWIFNTSLKLPILPLEAVAPVAIVHHSAPEEKKIDVQWIFDKYTDGFNEASIRAVTMISDEALASGLRDVAPELSKEEALRIAPKVKELANKKAPSLPKPHIETMEEYRDRKAKVFDSIKNEPIRDIKIEIQVNRDKAQGRTYPHVYVIKTAVTDKGEIKLDETIYKGSDEIKYVKNKGVDGYKREELYRVGKPLSDSIDKRYFTEYSDLNPKLKSGTLDTIPEVKSQIPLYYIDIDLPTGLSRLFGILHKGKIFGEKSAFSLTGVYDLKGWQPLSEKDYNVYKQSIGGAGKQAQRGKTIQWLEKNSDAVINAGEEELAKQEKSEQLHKEVQEAIKKAEKEHHLKASSLKVGDVLEWAVDKSRWVITEVKDGTVYARPESEPYRAGGLLGGYAKEGIVKGYKLVSQAKPEYKRPEYELEQWTALFAPHLNTWSWNYYVKGFTSWWQKVFGSFKELKDFLAKGQSELWVHGVRGDEKVKWTPITLTEPKLLKQADASRVRGDTLYSLVQPYFNSLDNKWVWRTDKGLLKTGEMTPGDVDEAELVNAKEFTEAQRIESRIGRELEKYRMDDYSKAEIGTLYFVPDLVRDLIQDAQKLPKATSEKYISILEDMRARVIAERNKREKTEKEKPVVKPADLARIETKVEQLAKTGAQKEVEKILRIDLDKYDAYEWGTRVKLIEKQAAKGAMKDVLATGHLSDEDYENVKPFIKGVQQPRKPLKPVAQFVAKPDKFFICAFDIDTDKHSFEEVEGKPITIKGFEGHDLFLHKTKGAAGYSITEGRSGTSVVRGIKTEKEARLETEKVLNKFKGTLDKKIAEAVRVAGLSPRYTAVELKRRVEKLVEKPSEKPEPKVERAVEKAIETVKPEPKPEPRPEPKPKIRVEPVHTEPKKPNKAKKSVNKFAKKFIKTEYGRAIVKKAKAGVIELTSDDLKADVIILRG